MTILGPCYRRFACLAWLVLLLPLECAAGEYRTADVESLKIAFDSDWAVRLAPGYVPVRIDLTNTGEARVIEIVAEGTRFSGMIRMGPSALRLRQSLQMARGDRVRLTIPVPVFFDSENIRFEIREGGETLERFNYIAVHGATPARNASAVIVANPGSEFGKTAATWARSAPGPTRTVITGPAGARVSSAFSFLDVVLEPGRLPGNWLGYTSLRAVVIGAAEWTQLEDDQKGALLTWIACGGDLIVVDGELDALAGGGHRTNPSSSEAAARAYFFGRVHRRSSASITKAGLNATLNEVSAVHDYDWGLPVNGARDWGVTVRGFRLAIPGVDGVPTRAYLSILIVFTLVIGPVNSWLLRRKRQQVLFVLTAPLISALFIALLGGYVLAGEGIRVSGRAATFTMLDQVRKQAVTRASSSLYAAGMTPGGGLSFPRDVAVYAIGPDGAGSRDNLMVDLTDAQRYASGVIHARAPTNVEAVNFSAARERLAFSRDAAGFTVVNGLGVPIDRLRFRSAGATYVLSGPLAAGATGTLRNAGREAPSILPANFPLSSRFLFLAEHQPEGSYLAVLRRSPFWQSGVRSVIERDSFHLVLGWPDGQP